MRRRLFKIIVALVLLALGVFVALPHVLPWALSQYRPDIRFIIGTSEKKLFLTIDDAPSKNTAKILRVLKKHEVSATFFVTADRVKSRA